MRRLAESLPSLGPSLEPAFVRNMGLRMKPIDPLGEVLR
jgi:hypothetical protein